MVERERQGMAAPIPETITRVLKTLVELGFDTAFDSLNLAEDRFTLGVKKDGEDTIFVGLLKHPLAGEHLAQFLNSVAPFGAQDRFGIIDDVGLPILAERDYRKGKDRTTSEYIRLHERHLKDPRVGPPYIRFAKDHADSWLRALEFSNGWKVFERLQRIRFINNIEDVRKELFPEGNIINSLNDSEVLTRVLYALRRSQNDRFRLISEDWYTKDEKGNKEVVEAVLRSFTKGEQKEFTMSYLASVKGQILVDLEAHRIRSDKSNTNDRIGKGKIKFVSNGRDVLISDKKGTKVVIRPTGQNSEKFSWKAIRYQFPESYIKFSLYPIIAWKKEENGTREFLTQQEAIPFIRELGLEEGEQGDVKLGEIGVGYFSRDIIKKWPVSMALKPLEGVKPSPREDDFEQPMRGAQMPAWVAVESHRAELLKSKTSVLALAEQYFGITA